MIGNPDKPQKRLLAVYGTLRKGFENHSFIENAKYLGTFKSEVLFFLVCIGPYPVLTPEADVSNSELLKLESENIFPSPIIYELYELTEEEWPAVCELEEYDGIRGNPNNLYDTMDIETDFGKAEIFIQHKIAEGTFVIHGDYSHFKGIHEKNLEGKNRRLAVYGTLRKGFGNHYLIKEAKFLGIFKTFTHFFMICNGDYPVLTPKTSLTVLELLKLETEKIVPNSVVYELYEVTEEQWNNVCRLEGYDKNRSIGQNLYDVMDLQTEFGIAKIFIQHKLAEGKLVMDGDYSAFKGIN